MEDFHFVPTAYWMRVPVEERSIIAEAFELIRHGVSEVVDNEVISDGYTAEDLKGITAEKMVAYVGSEAEFPRLWELTVAKARSIAHPALEIQVPPTVPESENLPTNKPAHAKGKAAAKGKK